MDATHICSDCEFKGDYEAITKHTHTAHNREPLCGPTVAVGDYVLHEGQKVRVLELLADGNMMVQPPSMPTSLKVEYRVAKESWANYVQEQPKGES